MQISSGMYVMTLKWHNDMKQYLLYKYTTALDKGGWARWRSLLTTSAKINKYLLYRHSSIGVYLQPVLGITWLFEGFMSKKFLLNFKTRK